MGNIDSLSIKIDASARGANQQLDKLVDKMVQLRSAVNGINVGNLGKMAASIQNFSKAVTGLREVKASDFTRMANNLEKLANIKASNLEQTAQGVERAASSLQRASSVSRKAISAGLKFDSSGVQDMRSAIKNLAKEYSGFGKGNVFEGTLGDLEKTADKLRKELDALAEKEEKILAVGGTSAESKTFKNLQFDISKTLNQLSELEVRIKELQGANANNAGIEIIRPGKSEKSLEYFSKELERMKESMKASEDTFAKRGLLDTPISNLEIDLGKLRSMYPEARELISSYMSEIERLKRIQLTTPIQSKTRGGVSEKKTNSVASAQGQQNSFRNFSEEIKNLKKELQGLEKSGKGMGSDEWEQMYLKLRKVTLEAKEYKNALNRHAAGLDEEIKKTDSLGNRVEGLKAKVKSMQEKGLNFGDPKFDSTYKELQKATGELKKYKSGLVDVGNTAHSVSGKIGNAFRSIWNHTKKAGRGIADFGGKVKSLTTRFRSMSSSADGLTKKLGKLFWGFVSLRTGAKVLKDSVDASMDYIEEYNYFDTVVGKIGKEWSKDYKKYGYENAEAYGDSFSSRMREDIGKLTGYSVTEDGNANYDISKNLGLDLTKMTNYAAGIMNVTNSLGMTGEASLVTAKAMSKLSGDMSSFKNVDLTTVMNNFQSGLIGQSRALYKYGIDITNATLANYAHEMGIKKDVSAMTQAEKMQLRMIAILDQSKSSWGDLAKTIQSPSNQFRMLKTSIAAAGRTLGNIFLPIVAKVLPYVNGLAIAVNRLLGYIFKITGMEDEYKKIMGESGGGYSDAFDGLEEDADNASDAVDDTTDSVKKLAKQLMGFDELNVITTNKDSDKDDDKNGIGKPIDLTDQLSAALADYEKVWNDAYKNMTSDAEKFADKLTKLFKDAWKSGNGSDIGSAIASWINGGIDWVNKNVDTFAAGLKKVAGILATSLNGFVEKLNWAGLGTAIGKSLKAFFDAETHFFDTVDWTKFGESLATSLNAAIDSGVIQSYIKSIASKFRAAIEFAFGAITTFNFSGLGKAIGQGINDFLDTMGKVNKKTGLNGWQELGVSITEGISGIADTLITALGTVEWKDVAQAIADFISSVNMGKIGWKLGKLVSSLSKALYILVSDKNSWKDLGSKIASGINGFFKGNNWETTGKAIGGSIKGILDAIITALEGISWIRVGRAIGGLISGIDFSKIIWRLLGLAKSIVLGIAQALLGSFSKAPIETSIVTMLAGLKFSGKLNASTFAGLGQKIAVAVGNATSSSGNLASLAGKLSTFFDTAIGSSATKLVKGAGIAAVVATVLSVAQNLTEKAAEKTFKESKLGEIVENVNASVKNLKKSTDNLKDSLKEVSKVDFDSLGEVDNLDSLAKKYEILSKKEKLSAGEKVKLKQYSQQLIQAIPSLNDLIDKTTGKYKGEWSQLKKLVEQKKLEYKLMAKEKALEKMGGDIYNAEENQKAAKKKRDDLQKQLTDLQKQHDKAIKENRKKGYDDSNLPLSQWADEEARFEKAVKKADKALKDSNKTLDKANKKFDDLAGSVEKDRKALNESKKTIKDHKKELKDSYNVMKKMKNKSVKLEVKNAGAKKNIKEIDDDIKVLQKQKNELKLKGDNADAKEKIKAVNTEIADLKAKKTTVKILGSNADAKTKLEAIEERRKQLNNREAIIKAKGDTEDAKEKLDAINKERKTLNGAEAKITVKADGKDAEDTVSSINSKIQKLNKEKVKIMASGNTKEAKKKLDEIEKQVDNLIKKKNIKIGITFGVKTNEQAKKSIKAAAKAARSTGNEAQAKALEQYANSLPKTESIPKFAKGGFPQRGQLFWANEKGPEMIGMMGRRTAVANKDQITSGISDGVFNALAPVLTQVVNAVNNLQANSYGGQPLYVEGVSDGDIVRITTDANSQHKKRFGKSLYD